MMNGELEKISRPSRPCSNANYFAQSGMISLRGKSTLSIYQLIIEK